MIKQNKNSGFSLLSVLVALGLGGILSVFLSTMLTNSMNAGKAIENDAEFASFRSMLASRLSCSKTRDAWLAATPSVTPASCFDVVPIYDKNGNLLISGNSSNPTIMGK